MKLLIMEKFLHLKVIDITGTDSVSDGISWTSSKTVKLSVDAYSDNKYQLDYMQINMVLYLQVISTLIKV